MKGAAEDRRQQRERRLLDAAKEAVREALVSPGRPGSVTFHWDLDGCIRRVERHEVIDARRSPAQQGFAPPRRK